MKFRRKIKLIVFILLLSIFLMVTSCDPSVPLQVENQTDNTIQIYVSGVYTFNVLPRSTNKSDSIIPATNSKYFIEGITEKGDIIYSRVCTLDEIRNKIVIKASEIYPYLPLEIENMTKHEVFVDIDFAIIGTIKPGCSLRKRVLSPDTDIYTIRARAHLTNEMDGVTTSTIKEVFKKTLTRTEIKDLNWKIIISPE